MRIIAKKTINAYRECYPDADGDLKSWVHLIENADFQHFSDLKRVFSSVDLIEKGRVVFNIKGNHYRLIADVCFQYKALYIKWFGRHKDYDKINPLEVKHEYPPC